MRTYETTLPGGARLVGYLRETTVEMPAYNVRPAVVILPGGGYAHCSNRESDPVAMRFLAAGYQTFVLYYTVTDLRPGPLRWQPMLDAAGAVLHLRRHAEEFHLDPDKIALCGFSAGGHLAACAAVLWDAPEVQQVLGITGTEARPNAVALGYPVITMGSFTHAGSARNLAGEDPDLLARMSLENQIRPGLPPFFIWHTVADQAVPVQNSLMLANALEACDDSYELHLFAHGDHGSSTCNAEVNTPMPHNAAWLPLCIDWLNGALHFSLDIAPGEQRV